MVQQIGRSVDGRWLAGAAALGVFAITLWTGVQHDHREYLVNWTAVLAGGDPWAVGNAYGPLHTVFAAPFAILPILPKLTFSALALACGALLLRASRAGHAYRTWGIVLALFLFNPVVLFSTYVYGQNDIVAAFLVLLAVLARDADRPSVAGVLIGLAALEKFYPIAIAGFLMLEGKRVLRLRIPLVAGATFAAGMGLATLVWGAAPLTPLRFAVGRDPKMLSVHRFLTCHPDLVGGDRTVQMLLDSNSPIVAVVGALSLGGLLWLGATWRSGTLIGCLVIFATYKVGHPQFYVTWLAVLTWLLVHQDRGWERSAALRLVPVAIALALFSVLYAATGAMLGEWAFLRCYVSLPFLAVVVGSIGVAVREIPRPAGEGFSLRW